MACCQVQWIDDKGTPTPDSNPPVAIAKYHEAIFAPFSAKVTAHKTEVRESYFICAKHLAMVRPSWLYGSAWEIEMLSQETQNELEKI
jgi:hypothetical protein